MNNNKHHQVCYVSYIKTDIFKQIYEILYAIKQDNIDGDYVEFGIFKGKSLYHAWRCINKLKLNFFKAK